jgi:hypothetical protein
MKSRQGQSVLLGVILLTAALTWCLSEPKVEDREKPADEVETLATDTKAASPSALNVVRDDQLILHENCEPMERCVDDYLNYLREAEPGTHARSEGQLEQALDSISGQNRSVFEGEPSPSALRDGLIQAMNIGHLLEGLDARALKYQTTPIPRSDNIQEYEVVFEDPYVGRFRALFLLPPGTGTFPGIVAHPGHSESAEYHRDNRYGRDLAEQGFAVLIIDPRANDGDKNETRVARQALLRGHTLVGLRAYEILLAQKFLRWESRVDGRRLGLQGHSGGSVVSNLVVRIDEGFTAYVSDLFSTYGVVLPREEGLLGDETSPEVYYWHASIEDLTTSRVPMIQEPYGYEEGPGAMFSFFGSQLD